MSASERENRLGVIESEIDPFRRLMTVSTILTELTPMGIGFGVTLSTEPWDPHPLTVYVARFAINSLMAADQLKTEELMCE